MQTGDHLIKLLDLQAHIEGGYYKRIYPLNKNSTDALATSIYYLLKSDDFSCWHRLKSDEMWNYHAGSNLILYQIDQYDNLHKTILGDIARSDKVVPQCVVPRGNWFAAQVESANSFTLLSCTVVPGFQWADFELGKQQDLLEKYPQHTQLIVKFTHKI